MSETKECGVVFGHGPRITCKREPHADWAHQNGQFAWVAPHPKECPHVAEGKGCACQANSRHQWLHAYAKQQAENLALGGMYKRAIEQGYVTHAAREAAESSLAALRDAVREWFARHEHSVALVVAADDLDELRALVDPQGAKDA